MFTQPFQKRKWSVQRISCCVCINHRCMKNWYANIIIILTRVARDWCIYASAPTLVCPQRFNSGSICPSTPFERYHRFTSPSKQAVDSQNFWRLSNTDAPVYVYGRAAFPALRRRSSEREKKLLNRLAASSFFQSFRRDRRRQFPISQLICQLSQLIFDRSHVNSSYDMPACKVIDLRTMDRLCVRRAAGPTV